MVVSNTSPIINLAAIGQLDLLRALYDEVLIPDAVYREIARFEEQPGAEAVQSMDWITCRLVRVPIWRPLCAANWTLVKRKPSRWPWTWTHFF